MTDGNKPKRNLKNTLSHLEFFKLCEEMRNNREAIQRECKSREQLVAFLTPLLTFKLSNQSIKTALEATGIVLENVRKNGSSHPQKHKNNTRIICVALMHLYNKLGEEPSAPFVGLHARTTKRGKRENNEHSNDPSQIRGASQ